MFLGDSRMVFFEKIKLQQQEHNFKITAGAADLPKLLHFQKAVRTGAEALMPGDTIAAAFPSTIYQVIVSAATLQQITDHGSR
jgi:hypothetical protein